MLGTVALLLLSALMALAGIPLIVKLVPPNEVFGVRTQRTLSHKHLWYEVNRFAGYAMVAVAVCMLLALTLWSNTLLRPVWLQFAVFALLVALAIGGIVLFERQAGTRKKRKRAIAEAKRPAVR